MSLNLFLEVVTYLLISSNRAGKAGSMHSSSIPNFLTHASVHSLSFFSSIPLSLLDELPDCSQIWIFQLIEIDEVHKLFRNSFPFCFLLLTLIVLSIA